MKHLSKIIHDIQEWCSCAAKAPYTKDLQNRLRALTPVEKSVIADFVYKVEYDIGTGRILALLDQISLISVRHYVNRIQDTTLLLNIYNDFLENQPLLFVTLVTEARNCVQLKAALETFLEDFVTDLQGLTTNPFKGISEILDLDSQKFLNENILSNFLKNGNFSIETAFSEQHLWTNEDPVKDKIITDCLLFGEIESHVSFLHTLARKQVNWRTFCEILRSLARIYGQKCVSLWRKVLAEDFKVFVKDKNEFLLYFILVTVRQLSLSSPNELKYADWYKQNIGEMTYKITKEEFQYVMKVLTKTIEHESNQEFINIHINTRIQAPPLCNELVFTFKAILRSRLDSLKGQKQPEVIEIDSL